MILAPVWGQFSFHGFPKAGMFTNNVAVEPTSAAGPVSCHSFVQSSSKFNIAGIAVCLFSFLSAPKEHRFLIAVGAPGSSGGVAVG